MSFMSYELIIVSSASPNGYEGQFAMSIIFHALNVKLLFRLQSLNASSPMSYTLFTSSTNSTMFKLDSPENASSSILPVLEDKHVTTFN